MGMGNIANSGMQASMTEMDVISNNISNANTVGFKKSTANFADLYPSLNDASSVQAGLGVDVSAIEQDFTTGDPNTTGLPSDLMIKNSGFFMMHNPSSGLITYTRAGHFSFDQTTGYFQQGSMRLQGFPAVNGVIPAGSAPTDLQLNTASIPATPTANVTQNGLNLNSGDSVPSVTPFDPNNKSSYNFSSSSQMYDSLGNQNTLSLYYVKTGSNAWNVEAYVNGTSVGTGALTFSTSGQLTNATGLSSLQFTPGGGAAGPQTFAVNMTGATQNSLTDNATTFSVDGCGSGTFQGYTIDNSGNVTVQYSNSQTILAGQVAIANFSTPEGLQDIGNMSWVATAQSGKPMINQTNSTNNLVPGSLELSNVDLTQEMVSLIGAQNTFQANAQVEQVYDQVMQTVSKL